MDKETLQIVGEYLGTLAVDVAFEDTIDNRQPVSDLEIAHQIGKRAGQTEVIEKVKGMLEALLSAPGTQP